MKKIFLILFGLSLLSACVSTHKALVWPENIPPLEYFRGYYAQDEQHQKAMKERAYLEWIKKFYLGSAIYSRGWNMVTNEVITSLDNENHEKQTRQRMQKLGKLISAEWAKHSKYRVINTRHISIWGNALLESISKKEQLLLISKVEGDVDALLTKQIKPGSIQEERYYQTSHWDDF